MVKDLNQYIESIVMDLEQRGKLLFDGFDDYLWLLLSGGKGGKLMKFHFEVINSKDAGSVYKVCKVSGSVFKVLIVVVLIDFGSTKIFHGY